MNENYAQPSIPENAKEGIIKGIHQIKSTAKETKLYVRLIGSGTILMEVIAAAEILENEFGISSDIFSATSYTELAREAASVARANRLSVEKETKASYVETLLEGDAPIIASSDYVRAFPQQIAPYLSARMTALGTDGFGRSANRVALRRFFEVDRQHIALAAVESLVRDGTLTRDVLSKAIDSLNIDPNLSAPWTL